MRFILVLIYLILTTSGLIFIKIGGNIGPIIARNQALGFTINWISILGFACYLCSFLLFTRIVVLFDLSYIIPICTGIVQVLVLIASKIIFKESMTIQGIIGASIIIIGILIMNIPKNINT